MNGMMRNVLVWSVIVMVLMFMFNSFNLQQGSETWTYNQFVNAVQNDSVGSVEIDGLEIRGKLSNGEPFKVILPTYVDDPKLMDDLLNHNVVVEAVPPAKPSLWKSFVSQ